MPYSKPGDVFYDKHGNELGYTGGDGYVHDKFDDPDMNVGSMFQDIDENYFTSANNHYEKLRKDHHDNNLTNVPFSMYPNKSSSLGEIIMTLIAIIFVGSTFCCVIITDFTYAYELYEKYGITYKQMFGIIAGITGTILLLVWGFEDN